MGGVNIGYGQQYLLDAYQRWARAGKDVYLRLRNFPDIQTNLAAGLGFTIQSTGATNTNSGTTDVLIQPPPAVTPISIHNIGQSQGKLRFGARMFLVSATFVDNQVRQQNLSPLDPDQVWRASNVVGLVTEGKLFSIEDIKHKEVGGKTIAYVLTANANELPSTP